MASTVCEVSGSLTCLFFFIQVFAGNADQDSVVYHDLNPPITSQYIRFVPVDYHLHISMRVELYGCLQGNEEWSPSQKPFTI